MGSVSNEDVKEAAELILLVAFEFKTDPMSVQCFDLRMVDRVTALADKIRAGALRPGEGT